MNNDSSVIQFGSVGPISPSEDPNESKIAEQKNEVSNSSL